jgi:ATP synthase F1 gamma subunit
LGDSLAGIVPLGRRTNDLLIAAGVRLVTSHDSPTSVGGIDDLVGWVAQVIGRSIDGQQCDGAEVVFMRLVNSGDLQPEVVRVLPVDPAKLTETMGARPPREPILYERSQVVAAALLREWTHIEVYRCALESLASEHDARLRTTDAATHALERRLEELRLEHNHLRQEAITEELLETVSGAQDLLLGDENADVRLG